jgi:mannose-6-phosphate isomerase-like protein (cupin superfamily)
MEPKTDWSFNIDSEADAEWTEGLRRIFDYRDLGIKDATNGDYIAQIIRANGKRLEDEVQHWHLHECTFQFVYVLNGWARFEYEGEGVRTLRKGDCINQRPMVKHREIEYSDDYEVLEIVAPADFKTVIVDAPESAVADESRAEAAD